MARARSRLALQVALMFAVCAVPARPAGSTKVQHKCPPQNDSVALKGFARRMFDFGHSNYMQHAFPLDELDPVHCTGRGVDRDNPENINVNDVLGNYSLGLIDSLDTIALMGDRDRFVHAVDLTIRTVSFDQDSIVQVFEVTIRAMGGLLSAHLIAKSDEYGMRIDDYDDELLWLARDLGVRLLPAFDESPTGIPHPRVNLRHGVPKGWRTDTCTAGAGSLLIEFGVLSRLTKDPVFEAVARRATMAIWERQDNTTGLLGSTIDAKTGKWIDKTASMGAGVDSYYEYLFKAYVLFGDHTYYDMFEAGITAIGNKMWAGNPPVFRNVNMETGDVANWWIDSLQAYASGMLSEAGMLDAAVEHHAFYYGMWLKYGALPERFNLQLGLPEVKFYPLRPEFAESTYYLYLATKDPFYRDVGRQIMCDIQKNTKAKCGYATVHDVTTMALEDRMESYFLSETVKYLFLLFDDDNAFTRSSVEHIFTTEGHIIPMLPEFRQPVILEGDEVTAADADLDAAAETQIVAEVLLDSELAQVKTEEKDDVKRLEGMIANAKKDDPDRVSELTEMIEETRRIATDKAANIKHKMDATEGCRDGASTGVEAEQQQQQQRVGQPICHGIPPLRRFYHPVANLHAIMDSVGVDVKTRTKAGLPPLPPPPPPPPPMQSKRGCFEDNVDYVLHDVADSVANVTSAFRCQAHCQASRVPKLCRFFTWNFDTNSCFLKSSNDTRVYSPEIPAISGPRYCPGRSPVALARAEAAEAMVKLQAKLQVQQKAAAAKAQAAQDALDDDADDADDDDDDDDDDDGMDDLV